MGKQRYTVVLRDLPYVELRALPSSERNARLRAHVEHVLQDIRERLRLQGVGESDIDISVPTTSTTVFVEASPQVGAFLVRDPDVAEVRKSSAPPAMRETPQPSSVPTAPSGNERPRGSTDLGAKSGARKFEDGADPKGLFASARAAVQGMRLRLEGKIFVSVEDLLAPLLGARQRFEERDFRVAYDKCDFVHREFGTRVARWKRAAEARLQAMKQGQQLGKIQQLKQEMADVQRQSLGADSLLSKLRDALDCMRH